MAQHQRCKPWVVVKKELVYIKKQPEGLDSATAQGIALGKI